MESRWTFSLAFVLALALIQAAVPGWAEDAKQGAPLGRRVLPTDTIVYLDIPDDAQQGTPGPNIEELQKQAEQGDAKAQFNLALCYANGDGVPQDYKEAVKWYTRAAEQGYADAQLNLGVRYYNGKGVPQDYKEAVKWFTRAAEQGYAGAQLNLGVCYAHGEGVPQDYKEAVKWFTQAAEQGDAQAQFNLALCYEYGKGVPKDYKEAVKWYTQAAEQGDVQAQFNLALCYANGDGVPQDYKEAVKWYTRAAEQGYADAQLNLGVRYYNGEGVHQDYKEAVKWYTHAAEQGYAQAQFNLALCYAHGEGVPQDYKEAVKRYTQAAEQGDAQAQFNLALCYAHGEGVPQDYKEAVKWYTQAAAQGDAQAQFNLALCYEYGKGVPKDLIRAYMWFNLVAMEDTEATKIRELIAQKMTPAQIAEAQRLSAAFVPRKEGESGVSPNAPRDLSQSVPYTAMPPRGTGTAFAITADGYLVTAAHVVAGAARVEVHAGGQSRPAMVLARDAINDVAVLKVEGAFSPVRLVSSGNLALGMDLFTVGFPDVQVQGTAPKLTKGSLSGLMGPGDDPRYFQLSNPIQPGNSGGAVANEKGEVVGVLVATLDLLKTIERTGQAPQNVNFALKSSYVLPLLESVPGLSGKIGAVKTGSGNAYQAVTDATVMVLVW